ncbi:hypothetical protein C1646_764344 [Rhizophagus diaphanus]|nr:hypothetical protein C1646_764344 [Rhizophagus diaphanus] [Rhizophagus sp. MUCL 43196]
MNQIRFFLEHWIHEEQNKAQQVAANLKKQIIKDLIEAFAIANISFKKVNSLLLFLKKYVKNKDSISQASTLRQIYLPNIFKKHHQYLKLIFNSKPVAIIIDEITDDFFDPKYIYTEDISQKDIWQYDAIHEFANPLDELLREWEIYCGLGCDTRRP